MALTQAEWFDKLKSWVPTWFVNENQKNIAMLNAIAKVMQKRQVESEEMVANTYITSAADGFLDMHGNERLIPRKDTETDPKYATRIRYIDNSSSYDTILTILKASLGSDEIVLIENWNFGFADLDLFADADDAIYLSKYKATNYLSIVVPLPGGSDPYELGLLIIEVLDENKALGVAYDIVFRTV